MSKKRISGAVQVDRLFRGTTASMMPKAAKGVLRCLAGHRNDKTGRCDPGYATIAGETSTGISTVKRALEWLIGHGWVTVTKREAPAKAKGAKGPQLLSNQYALHITPDDIGRWHRADETSEAIPESVPTPATLREAAAPVSPTPPPSTPKPEPEATTPEKPQATFALTAPTTLKPARRKRAKLVPVPMPADWKPSAENEAFAKARSIDLGIEVHSFTEHYRGTEQPSWNGRFATWLANAAKWGAERTASRPGVSKANICQPSGAALSIAEF